MVDGAMVVRELYSLSMLAVVWKMMNDERS